jgi:hypothetical protein
MFSISQENHVTIIHAIQPTQWIRIIKQSRRSKCVPILIFMYGSPHSELHRDRSSGIDQQGVLSIRLPRNPVLQVEPQQ